MIAGIFDHPSGQGVEYAPTARDCKGTDGWWRCLDSTPQAIIIASVVIAIALVLAAIVIRVTRRR